MAPDEAAAPLEDCEEGEEEEAKATEETGETGGPRWWERLGVMPVHAAKVSLVRRFSRDIGIMAASCTRARACVHPEPGPRASSVSEPASLWAAANAA